MSKITARDHKLLALLKSGKTLIYIAPLLALEMFSQKMGYIKATGTGSKNQAPKYLNNEKLVVNNFYNWTASYCFKTKPMLVDKWVIATVYSSSTGSLIYLYNRSQINLFWFEAGL